MDEKIKVKRRRRKRDEEGNLIPLDQMDKISEGPEEEIVKEVEIKLEEESTKKEKTLIFLGYHPVTGDKVYKEI